MTKIRLTGLDWDTNGYEGVPRRGSVYRAENVDGDMYSFEVPGYPSSWYAWGTDENPYGAELVDEEVEEEEEETSRVEHPSHYNAVDGMPEVWDILDAFFPDDPDLWNAGKYLLRAGRKDDKLQEIEKLIQYAQRAATKLREKKENN